VTCWHEPLVEPDAMTHSWLPEHCESAVQQLGAVHPGSVGSSSGTHWWFTTCPSGQETATHSPLLHAWVEGQSLFVLQPPGWHSSQEMRSYLSFWVFV